MRSVVVDDENIFHQVKKSNKTMVTAIMTIQLQFQKTKKICIVNLKHHLHGEIDDFALKWLVLRSGPTQYLQQQ